MTTRAHQLPPDQICRTVLEQVNRALSSAGKCTRQHLPLGKALDPNGCVIYEALRPLGATMSVFPGEIVTDAATAQFLARCWGTTARPCRVSAEKGRWEATTPGHMRRFIRSFDQHESPFDQFDMDLQPAPA